MKRSSSSLDQRTNNNDETSHQASNAKMARRSSPRPEDNHEEKINDSTRTTTTDSCVVRQDLLCFLAGIFLYINNNLCLYLTLIIRKCQGDKSLYWSPSRSLIIGSFSEPQTYVIHFLDSHLTFVQSFQICSLYGRVRIHGYTLRPLQFYSVYNYRTNSPLSIEFIDSIATVSVPDLKSIIPDSKLADDILVNVEEKGGDVLLLRKETNNESLFIQTLREHQLYEKWFTEEYHDCVIDQWRQLEKDLYIRLIETTDQSSVIPRQEFISTADHVIHRWLSESKEDLPFTVLICGEKDMGKSTFTRYLINRAIDHVNTTFGLTYFDCDIGQCEFTISGCISYTDLDSPLLGPPCSHIRGNPKPNRLLYYGLVSPQVSPVRYLEYVSKLRQLWTIDHSVQNRKRFMKVINTMGWGTGLGLELLKETISMCSPNVVIQIGGDLNSSQDPNTMPDVTLEWLSKQPVYAPYRNAIKMDNKRHKDYDGKVNYEYIKIRSTASLNTNPITKSKLQARDHRTLALWSYFFSSSNLSRISLPWSNLIHVSLFNKKYQNPNVIPERLEHTIVGLCSSEKIDQLRASAALMNGTYQLFNYQNEFFECLGFGWIEYSNKRTQTYEIYTPIQSLSNINLLVYGAFDTPDEFQYMFADVNRK